MFDRAYPGRPSLERAETMPTGRLIDHIVTRFHRPHLEELADAIVLAERVEATHKASDDCPLGLADLLARLAEDLEIHQHKEEAVVFPLLLRGGGRTLAMPMARMLSEHDGLNRDLATLARLTAGFTPPAQACTTWRLLYGLCAKLDADLREHLRLENDVLFPRFDGQVAPAQGAPARE